MGWDKYVFGALLIAAVTHIACIYAAPRLMMNVAIERVGGESYNSWRLAERVSPASRQIVRPSPDFAYSACAYDLSAGPVTISAAPWSSYWSLSLYAANSDNYYVIDDREAEYGAGLTLIRRGARRPDGAAMIVESPSERGIALIRRLAPSPAEYRAAAETARRDVCASLASLAG
ncbi:MAG TPA: DUF1254 domain-containing protein [Vitreimonas sp.]|uniref:DUF1254 domain-containing protein n=1 Tax=Vitreimonas sp. TaxID=3069702 RepID=UPI002D739177|nr:DUF1254 domain-containing protein [Vitreimonas sp.]HYD88690.1 DUF1254 domain-containing protein [Vitreimonas sp.]